MAFSQNDLLEAIVVRFSSAKRNARVAPPPILIGLAQYGFSQNGLLEAIVVRFWECNVKRAHAAAANFDGGGPMWPITKARDTKRAGTAELCQMCMHFPHSPHHAVAVDCRMRWEGDRVEAVPPLRGLGHVCLCCIVTAHTSPSAAIPWSRIPHSNADHTSHTCCGTGTCPSVAWPHPTPNSCLNTRSCLVHGHTSGLTPVGG
ncbi:hypothetical protein B0H10DRAFT_1950165 [Mycena sp. CBHHK59/15]|nr:hypothetical protein B0H10DRAFT_1950165 [Mycena sp. CBHHK59/15]